MTASSSVSAAPQDRPPRPAQQPRGRRFKTLRVTTALMMREIASTDSRTSLGFLWQFIEPVATIALMTLFFQMMTRTPPLGTNYPLFYVTGVLPFQMFTVLSNKISSALRFSRPLLGFPSVSVLDAIAARFILNFVIEGFVFITLAAGIIWAYDLHIVVDVPMAAGSLLLAAGLALGIGTFNSVLFVALPVYETMYGVISRPLMLVSGVLFLTDSMPEPIKSWILWNPVTHPVSMMRAAFFAGADRSHIDPFYVILIALVTFTLGLVTLRRYFRDAMDR